MMDLLVRGVRVRGHSVWVAVGRKLGSDRLTYPMPQRASGLLRLTGYGMVQSRLQELAGRYPGRGFGLASRALRVATHPGTLAARHLGREDFDFPGTFRLLDLPPGRPDIVHVHNLHGDYFDLRALPWLSHQVPTMITLHDAWLLSGHCAYPVGCDRWQTGCGRCPDLKCYPAVRRDATAWNWRRKQGIYEASRLYVTAPSQWMLDLARRSILAPAMAGARVVANGVDCAIFRPADRTALRTQMDIRDDALVLLLTAGSRGSEWKDIRTARAAAAIASERLHPRPVVTIQLTDPPAGTPRCRDNMRFVGYQTTAGDVARFLQVADVYLHAAGAETFGLMVAEAMACGTPVVASAVGGIPEVVCPVPVSDICEVAIDRSHATGVLVPPNDPGAMAEAAVALLRSPAARRAMGRNAVRDVAARFDAERQIDEYVRLYEEILEQDAAELGRNTRLSGATASGRYAAR